VVFLAVDFAGIFDGAAEEAGAAEVLVVTSVVAVGVVVVVEAAPMAGLVAGAVVAGAVSAAFPPQALAEHDAIPEAAGVAVAGTSFAWTGCGSPPPQATSALVPSAAKTAVRFSIDRLGRMGFSPTYFAL
jgi:hypothetical protein